MGSRFQRTRATHTLVVVGAVALLARACGDDEESSDATPDSTAAPAVDVVGDPNPTSGEAVHVGLITEAGSESVGRIGEPGEVADFVRWLCSSARSFVTSAAIAADGGLTAS